MTDLGSTLPPARWPELVVGSRFGHTVVFAPSTTSTMDMAERAVAAGDVRAGTVFLTGQQTQGRGMGDRRWESGAPDGLWQTIVLDAPEPPHKAPIVFLTGIALSEMLREEFGVDAHPKWVNDVLVGQRKISGTLVRRVGGKYLVGVGLNVNQAAMTGVAAEVGVSLRILTGRVHDLAAVWRAMMLRLDAEFASPTSVVTRMRELCRMLGKTVTAIHAGDGARRRVVVRDLDAQGHLVVVGEDGKVEVWHSPDPWRIAPGE